MFNNAIIKIEKFDRFKMVRKSTIEKYTEYLNKYFHTNKFAYSKNFDDLAEKYRETITARSFPKEQINIELMNNATRIDFIINLTEQQTDEMKSIINFTEFEDEYRIYQNRPDTISLYISPFNKDKWLTYTDKYKIEYLANGIERMSQYLNEIIGEVVSLNKVKVA